MYAVIKSGGKQYRVQPGDIIRVEKLNSDLGSEIDIKDIVMVGGDAYGLTAQELKSASVIAVVTRQAKDKKVIVFKKKRRQGYRRFGTHRQTFTELFVKSISYNGKTSETDQVARIHNPQAEALAAKEAAQTEEGKTKIAQAKKEKSAAKRAKKATAAPKKKAVKKAKASPTKKSKKTTKKA
jgi:large subunit ribosomal protein L21